jgi:hypothetical protein
MRNVTALLVFLALLALGVYAGHIAELRVRSNLAWQCAQQPDTTQADARACFTSRDLPQPERK